MRSLHFCDTSLERPDGIARSVLTTVKARQDTERICVVAPDARPTLPAHQAVSLRSIAIPGRDYCLPIPTSTRALPVPEVVHVHTFGPIGVLGIRYARSHRLPLVLTWHTDYRAYAENYLEIRAVTAVARLLWRKADRTASDPVTAWCNLADLVIAPSLKTSQHLAATGIRAETKLLATPADLPAPAAGDRRQVRAEFALGNAPTILGVGRLAKEKNWELLILGFYFLLTLRPDARLLILGGGRHEPNLKALARRLLPAGSFRFLAPVGRAGVAALMVAADVVVLPSLTETQGLVLDEAELVGTPTVVVDPKIATRTDGAARACARPEPYELARTITETLAAPRPPATPAFAPQDRAGETTLSRFSGDLEEVYQQALAARRHRPAVRPDQAARK